MRDRFIREYLADPERNGKQAAIRAGYSPRTAESQASRLLRSVKVRAVLDRADAKAAAAVARVIDRYAISKERIARELAISAFGSLADYLRIGEDGVPVVNLSGCDSDQLAALAEITVDHVQTGSGEDAQTIRRIKVKPYDRNKALLDLAKLCGFIEEKKPEGSNTEQQLIDLVRSLVSRESALPIGQQRRLAPVEDAEIMPALLPSYPPHQP
jgi:phage terminase small subunit